MDERKEQRDVTAVVATLTLPPHVTVRAWDNADFAAVQRLSTAEGWSTPAARLHEALVAWRHSWPALVAVYEETVMGVSAYPVLGKDMLHSYPPVYIPAAGTAERGVCALRIDVRPTRSSSCATCLCPIQVSAYPPEKVQ